MDSFINITKTLIIQDNIENLWFIIINPSFLTRINSSLFSLIPLNEIEIEQNRESSPLDFIIECKGSQYNYLAKLNDIGPYTKAIIYKVTSLIKANSNDSNQYDIKVYLFQITESDSTLIEITINQILPEQYEEVNAGLDTAIGNIKAYLFNLTNSVYQNESTVLKVSITDAWKYILDWENDSERKRGHPPNAGEVIYIGGTPIFNSKPIQSNSKQEQKKIAYKVKQVNTSKENTKWEYIIEEQSNVIMTEIKWTFIIINDNQLYFSLCHKLNHPINPQSINLLSKDKREYLTKMKKIMEQKNMD